MGDEIPHSDSTCSDQQIKTKFINYAKPLWWSPENANLRKELGDYRINENKKTWFNKTFSNFTKTINKTQMS